MESRFGLWIPDYIEKRRDLTWNEKVVLCKIMFISKKKTEISDTEIANYIGMPLRTMKRTKKRLKELGIIDWTTDKQWGTTRYTITEYENVTCYQDKNGTEPQCQNGTEEMDSRCQNDTGTRCQNGTHKKYIGKNGIEMNMDNINVNTYTKSSKDPFKVSFNWK